ncbi:MAG: YwaF family protein [Solobacterium sp.]|nr:YwaF family protein [Solobacterium sp.]
MEGFLTETPMFGAFHITAASLSILLGFLYCRSVRRRNHGNVDVALFRTGLFLLGMECVKQLYLFLIVNQAQYYSWWYFPFQLCSMPMYLCIALKEAPEERKGPIRTFLYTYGLIGALAALAWPEDILLGSIFLKVHGFLWHGLMVGIAMVSADKKEEGFSRTVQLFLFLCVCAEIINTAGTALRTYGSLPDMFYISPFTAAGQPVFRIIARYTGRIPEIGIYLCTMTLAAYLLYLLNKKRA